MKNIKKFTVVCATALVLATTSVTTFAAPAYNTAAEAAAGVTGKSIQEVVADRQTGKSYGTIAAEAGKLDEFQTALLEMRKDTLYKMVEYGEITQKQADATLEAIENMQTTCNGTGIGARQGRGRGCGAGRGLGLRNGSCVYR